MTSKELEQVIVKAILVLLVIAGVGFAVYKVVAVNESQQSQAVQQISGQ